MRTLVYKRTHNGDPDEQGRFGIHDCMGRIRARDYAAVIGVGGIGPEATRNEIAGKVTWIGIGPHKVPQDCRGPLVMFDHFLYFGTTGPRFVDLAPRLANEMYDRNIRSKMVDSKEVDGLVEMLARAAHAPASAALAADRPPQSAKACRPKLRPRRSCS